MNWLLIGGATLLAGGVAFLLYKFFSNPANVAGFIKVVTSAAFKVALAEILDDRKSPDEEKAYNDFIKTNPTMEDRRNWDRAYRKRKKLANAKHPS